ncbi:MAG: response regulator [Chloroflexaceae bacterium]|nr:response regulator [Chloroflexaceae bacterium]
MKVLKVKPDLILLDVGMPNIDGYKLCSLIRKNRLFKDTPIVMVTGHKSLIDKTRARLAGATDFLSKPFSSTELLDMVYQYLPE